MNHDEFVGLIEYLGCDHLHKTDHFEGLVYCSHSENPNDIEGNCCFELCPLKKMWLDAKNGLDEHDPFFREEDEL